ncbi:MAG TPA: patatin-like phospholipase family protein [Dokdonella sp.]
MTTPRSRSAATRKVARERMVRAAAAGGRTKSKALPSPADSAASYETVALVLQGGGALGSYQCGVYEALHEAGVRPNWFAGTSIGAINAAILAGNAPEHRIARLQEFWNTISETAGALTWPFTALTALFDLLPPNPQINSSVSALNAVGALVRGQRGFFSARSASPFLFNDGSAKATSFYDTSPLKSTLERLIDFDRINSEGVRLSVGAANVRSGNVRYFDSSIDRIRAEHIMASGALPPAFPAIVIDEEPYWDGGTVSNTPLDYVLTSEPRRDSLVFQVDLWSARGDTPRTMMEVMERQKDIQYSSRTRFGTDVIARLQKLRNALGLLLKEIPAKQVQPELLIDLQPWLCDRVFNIIHLIYHAKHDEEQYKDYAFDVATMRDHWASGLGDMQRSLTHPQFFVPPTREVGVVTHDIHRRTA